MNPIFYSPELDELLFISSYMDDGEASTHGYATANGLTERAGLLWGYEHSDDLAVMKYDWVFVGYL